MEIKQGRVYRAKKPRNNGGYYNDRQVIYMSVAVGVVVTVALGAHAGFRIAGMAKASYFATPIPHPRP